CLLFSNVLQPTHIGAQILKILWNSGVELHLDSLLLQAAAQAGDLRTTRFLVEDVCVRSVVGEGGLTPFLIACENGHADVAEYLLRRGLVTFAERARALESARAVSTGNPTISHLLEVFATLDQVCLPEATTRIHVQRSLQDALLAARSG